MYTPAIQLLTCAEYGSRRKGGNATLHVLFPRAFGSNHVVKPESSLDHTICQLLVFALCIMRPHRPTLISRENANNPTSADFEAGRFFSSATKRSITWLLPTHNSTKSKGTKAPEWEIISFLNPHKNQLAFWSHAERNIFNCSLSRLPLPRTLKHSTFISALKYNITQRIQSHLRQCLCCLDRLYSFARNLDDSGVVEHDPLWLPYLPVPLNNLFYLLWWYTEAF